MDRQCSRKDVCVGGRVEGEEGDSTLKNRNKIQNKYEGDKRYSAIARSVHEGRKERGRI